MQTANCLMSYDCFLGLGHSKWQKQVAINNAHMPDALCSRKGKNTKLIIIIECKINKSRFC